MIRKKIFPLVRMAFFLSGILWAEAPGVAQGDRENSEILLAASSDGFQWKPDPSALFNHASSPELVALSDNRFYLCWVDFSSPGSGGILMHATSTDGHDWSRPAPLKIQGLKGKAQDPALVQVKRGTLRLFYLIQDPKDKLRKIHSALSQDDGQTFVEEAGVRYEAEGVANPDVVRSPTGQWIMYLSHGRETVLALSVDGKTFTDTGLVLSKGGTPGAVALAQGGIRLFVSSPEGMKSLVSEDGINFTEEPGLRLPAASHAENADPSVARTRDGKWLMAF